MKQAGHEGRQTTYGTYGHLYPARREELARRLDDIYGAAAGSPVGWRGVGAARW